MSWIQHHVGPGLQLLCAYMDNEKIESWDRYFQPLDEYICAKLAVLINLFIINIYTYELLTLDS